LNFFGVWRRLSSNISKLSWTCPSFQGCTPYILPNRCLKRLVYSPESQGCCPGFCLGLSSLGPELYYLMLIVAKAPADFHISDQFFLVPILAMHLYFLAPLPSGFNPEE